MSETGGILSKPLVKGEGKTIINLVPELRILLYVMAMAGGVILMGVLSLLLPVSAAMVLHGVAQTASNGSRIVFHRTHIRWPVLIPYLIGALAALVLFTVFIFVPQKALIFIVVGLFPFLSLAISDRFRS